MEWIEVAPGIEYSADPDFFLENQISVVVGQQGTTFCSRIEKRRFMHSDKRNISPAMTEHLCRFIHREICRKYGGEQTAA